MMPPNIHSVHCQCPRCKANPVRHSIHCRCKVCRPDLFEKPGQVVTPSLPDHGVDPDSWGKSTIKHSYGCQCEACMQSTFQPIQHPRPEIPYQMNTPSPINTKNVDPSTLDPADKPSNWPHGFWDLLCQIAKQDTRTILQKEHTYKGSWKKRGGQGAFFTFARPIDRYEEIAKQGDYDLLGILQKEYDSGTYGQDGTLSATVKDIRCYLLLLEAEAASRNQPYPTPHE